MKMKGEKHFNLGERSSASHIFSAVHRAFESGACVRSCTAYAAAVP